MRTCPSPFFTMVYESRNSTAIAYIPTHNFFPTPNLLFPVGTRTSFMTFSFLDHFDKLDFGSQFLSNSNNIIYIFWLPWCWVILFRTCVQIEWVERILFHIFGPIFDGHPPHSLFVRFSLSPPRSQIFRIKCGLNCPRFSIASRMNGSGKRVIFASGPQMSFREKYFFVNSFSISHSQHKSVISCYWRFVSTIQVFNGEQNEWGV